jgi:hypothetical protein
MNSTAIRAMIIAIVNHRLGDESILKDYVISRRFCRKFVNRELNWTFRKATTSGQKLPINWQAQCDLLVERTIAAIGESQVKHPSLIINWDQTAILYSPTSKCSFALKNAKQVPVNAIDDKRQITAVTALSMDGNVLPFQLVFQGEPTSTKATPEATPAMKLAKFNFAQTKNHWSNFSTMCKYVQHIIVPYVQRMAITHGIDQNPVKAVILLDCWSVHRGQEFLNFMKTNYPEFTLVFIPAGCTGKIQPADVLLQRPLKNMITTNYTSWTISEIKEQLQSGKAAEQIRLSESAIELKKQMMHWISLAWSTLQEKKWKDYFTEGWAKLKFVECFSPTRQLKAITKRKEAIDSGVLRSGG